MNIESTEIILKSLNWLQTKAIKETIPDRGHMDWDDSGLVHLATWVHASMGKEWT